MKNTTFKHNSPRPRSKKTLFVLVAVVILALLIVGGFYYNQKQDAQKAAEQQKAQDEAQTDSAKKEDLATKSTGADSKGDTQNAAETNLNAVTSSELTASIRSVSQVNSTVTADVVLSGSSQPGTCLFTFSTSEAQPVVRQVTSSTSGCSTQIPEVEFAKLGEWKLALTYAVGNKKTEATQNVTIN